MFSLAVTWRSPAALKEGEAITCGQSTVHEPATDEGFKGSIHIAYHSDRHGFFFFFFEMPLAFTDVRFFSTAPSSSVRCL
jgi:hypothetical protein